MLLKPFILLWLCSHDVFIYNHVDNIYCDPNLTIECLWRTLKSIEDKIGELPRNLYLQFDNSGRENRNTQVRVCCTTYQMMNYLTLFNIGFYDALLVGWTWCIWFNWNIISSCWSPQRTRSSGQSLFNLLSNPWYTNTNTVSISP